MSKKNVCIVLIIALVGILLLPGFVLSSDLYATDPVPLTPAECGQCHVTQYGDLKNHGGQHRFACQDCHERFHAYNPRKNNYDALMPLCSQCHDLPHGSKQKVCLDCHSNPHTPLKVPAQDRLASACSDCHAGPTNELKKFPSAHTEQGCQSCHHERHGYIPNCSECHDGHYPGQTMATCANCHQRVHNPLQIKLAANADTQTCGGCHGEVYGKWQNTISKHGKVSCGMCHQQHGQIPDCRTCHSEPHDKRQLEMFPDCITCHIDVHDLPVKRKK